MTATRVTVEDPTVGGAAGTTIEQDTYGHPGDSVELADPDRDDDL